MSSSLTVVRGTEHLAYASIGLSVLICAALYAAIRSLKAEVVAVVALQERVNEEHKERASVEGRLMARIDRMDKDWRALFAAGDEYLQSIEARVQRLEHRMDEVQGRHDGEKIDLNRLT